MQRTLTNGFTLLPLTALLLTWAALPAAAESNRAAKPNIVFLLAADGAERINLLSARPEDATRLKAKLAAWESEVKPVR